MNNDNIKNYFGLANQNNILYDTNLILNSNDPMNIIYFFQIQRMLKNDYINYNNNFIQDYHNSLFYSNNNIMQNDFVGNYINNLEFYYQFIRSQFIYDNNSNLKNLSINKDSNILNLKFKENESVMIISLIIILTIQIFIQI